MSFVIVWIDSEHARLFELHADGRADKHHVDRHEPDHHTHARHEGPKHDDHFFHQVIAKLQTASQLLLVGPGLARTHFQSHLTKHHHNDLAKKVVGNESLDHPTDNQIEAFGRKFIADHKLILA